MGEKLFPMYCGQYAIHGWDEEKSTCDALLALARPKEKVIVLFYANDTDEWIYGQCNFIHDKDHIAPFKFLNSFANLSAQRVFPTLIDTHGVDKVFFINRRLWIDFPTILRRDAIARGSSFSKEREALTVVHNPSWRRLQQKLHRCVGYWGDLKVIGSRSLPTRSCGH
jgi:hypothetical protein